VEKAADQDEKARAQRELDGKLIDRD
jgi:hypothetical protein